MRKSRRWERRPLSCRGEVFGLRCRRAKSRAKPARRSSARSVPRGVRSTVGSIKRAALLAPSLLHRQLVGHRGAKLRLLDEAGPDDARLIARRTVAIAERRGPVHGRGRPVIECRLLRAVGRKDGHDDSDKDANFQNGHVGFSNLVPVPSLMDSRPISTNCLMQAEKLRSNISNFYTSVARRWRGGARRPQGSVNES